MVSKITAKMFACILALISAEIVFASSLQSTGDTVDFSCPQGLPATWNGDAYNKTNCEIVTQLPDYLDGYLLCETSASYGDQSNPLGQKLIHMFDGISAVASFDLNSEQSTFSGAYYPTQSFKVWDLYDRDMSRSTIAWRTAFSPWNVTQEKTFKTQLTAMKYPEGQPNVDFWKIGKTIVTGTESYNLGLEFDVPTLTDFKGYPFIENNTYFNKTLNPKAHFVPIHMAIHERTDLATGLIWNSIFSLQYTSLTEFDQHELVYTVDPDGYRNIVGDYTYENFDKGKCDYKTGVYSGDPSHLPAYMHSTTSSENFFILPLTSNVFNPCAVNKNHPRPDDSEPLFNPHPLNDSWSIYVFNPNANLRFLLFDKRDNTFRMIYHNYPHFVTHQINAYEFDETTLYVDMVVYDDGDYSTLYMEYLLPDTGIPDYNAQAHAHLYRFTIDLKTNTTTNATLVPDVTNNYEFTQFNHKYEGLKYQWGYALNGGYVKNSSILKIDVNDNSGKNNKVFYEGWQFSFSEPVFVARPNPTSEDDGVVVVRGLDTTINKTRVFVVDALSMTKIGEVIAPDVVPFGFHNRYFSKESLGLPTTNTTTTTTVTSPPTPPSSTSTSSAVVARNFGTLLFTILVLAYVKLV